jgi:hypothetical protein
MSSGVRSSAVSPFIAADALSAAPAPAPKRMLGSWPQITHNVQPSVSVSRSGRGQRQRLAVTGSSPSAILQLSGTPAAITLGRLTAEI